MVYITYVILESQAPDVGPLLTIPTQEKKSSLHSQGDCHFLSTQEYYQIYRVSDRYSEYLSSEVAVQAL